MSTQQYISMSSTTISRRKGVRFLVIQFPSLVNIPFSSAVLYLA